MQVKDLNKSNEEYIFSFYQWLLEILQISKVEEALVRIKMLLD